MKKVFNKLSLIAKSGWGLLFMTAIVLTVGGFTADLAAAQSGEPPSAANSPLRGPGDHQGGQHGLGELLDGIVDFDEIVAGALGITVDELDAAREAGTPMPELIDELGLDQETVRQEIQSAVEAAVEQAVTDGTLTEEEAEAFLNPPAPPQRGQGEGPGDFYPSFPRAFSGNPSLECGYPIKTFTQTAGTTKCPLGQAGMTTEPLRQLIALKPPLTVITPSVNQ
jgi:hypothetical protein